MRYARAIPTCICAIIVMAGLAKAGEWQGIVPLHSTRVDVERLLGNPVRTNGLVSTYKTKNERVQVFYSDGVCKEGSSARYNVLSGTVLSFIVYPNAKLLVSDLKLDMTKYKREVDIHGEHIIYYFNREEGIILEGRVLPEGGEDVQSITYEPAAKDKHLRCPVSTVRQSCDKISSRL
jgi:hypothetical protein